MLCKSVLCNNFTWNQNLLPVRLIKWQTWKQIHIHPLTMMMDKYAARSSLAFCDSLLTILGCNVYSITTTLNNLHAQRRKKNESCSTTVCRLKSSHISRRVRLPACLPCTRSTACTFSSPETPNPARRPRSPATCTPSMNSRTTHSCKQNES